MWWSKVVWFRWGHKGWSPHVGICFYKDMKKHGISSPQPSGTQPEGGYLLLTEEERSHQKGLILDFTDSRTVRNDYLLLNSPSLWEFHCSSLSWLKGFEPLGWNSCPCSVISCLSVDVLCSTCHSWYYDSMLITTQRFLPLRSRPEVKLLHWHNI